MANYQEDCYYSVNKSEILLGFRMWVRNLKTSLINKCSLDDETITSIIKEFKYEFELILGRLHDIGGENNPLTREYIFYTQWLAVYLVLKRYGKTVEEIGNILYEDSINSFSLVSSEEVLDERQKWFSSEQSIYRKSAEKSKENGFEFDWVYNFVEGDGEEFDFGLDFCECAVYKLFHSFGAGELVSYVCAVDFGWSQAFGMGVERTQSIAQGHKVCNLRWKKGRDTKVGWIPESLKEYF